MKINGSLVFDASSASEIQNLRVEKLTALPTFGSSDNGRLVYNTTNNTMYFGQNGGWIPIATGGNAAALQAEVNALGASLGGLVGDDGVYNAGALTGNLASSTSVTNVFEKIQALVAAEVTRATAAEGVLTTALAQEVTDRVADVDAEEARAMAAEGILTTAAATEASTARAAEAALSTSISNEVTRAETAEAAIEAKIGKMYFLYSGTSSDTHVVDHALGQKYCNVTVLDSSDEVVIPQSITFNTDNRLTVTFNTAFVCKVVVMGLAAV